MVLIWGFAPLKIRNNLLDISADPGSSPDSSFPASKAQFTLGRLCWRTKPASFPIRGSSCCGQGGFCWFPEWVNALSAKRHLCWHNSFYIMTFAGLAILIKKMNKTNPALTPTHADKLTKFCEWMTGPVITVWLRMGGNQVQIPALSDLNQLFFGVLDQNHFSRTWESHHQLFLCRVSGQTTTFLMRNSPVSTQHRNKNSFAQ